MKQLTMFVILACNVYASQAQNIYTIAGNCTRGYNGDNIPATVAEFSAPSQLTMDAFGNLYIADAINSRVRMVNTSGIIFTIAGNGTSGYNGEGMQATAAELDGDDGIALDQSGNLYIADHLNNIVRIVNTSGIISIVAGTRTPGYTGDGGPATAAEINEPCAVALDDSGNIYMAVLNDFAIRKVNKSGIISTVAGNGTKGFSGDGGPATAAELSILHALTIDDSGNIYLTDASRIRKVNSLGIISTVAGDTGTGYNGDGGPATAAELSSPEGVAVDTSGNIYIGDYGNNRIRMVNKLGIISTVAGDGAPGHSGDGGPATAAEMHDPTHIYVDASGNLFISDFLNNCIREVTKGSPLSVNKLTNTEEYLSVYPLPNNGKFTIQLNDSHVQLVNQLKVYNMLGENVYSLFNVHFPLSIDLGALNNGIYILSIITSQGILNKRIEVVR